MKTHGWFQNIGLGNAKLIFIKAVELLQFSLKKKKKKIRTLNLHLSSLSEEFDLVQIGRLSSYHLLLRQDLTFIKSLKHAMPHRLCWKKSKTSGTRTMPTSALQLFQVHFQKAKVTSLGSCITAGTGPSICM